MSQNKEAFEPTGLIPRSIIRTVDRFLQQLLPGKEKIAIQEYRVSRYQILVSIKSLFIIVSIPLVVNYTIKALLLTPLTEHFWNLNQTEIFLNQYQEKRAFAEMQDFSEKMFFELLSEPSSDSNLLEPGSNDYLSMDHQQNVGLFIRQSLSPKASSELFSKRKDSFDNQTWDVPSAINPSDELGKTLSQGFVTPSKALSKSCLQQERGVQLVEFRPLPCFARPCAKQSFASDTNFQFRKAKQSFLIPLRQSKDQTLKFEPTSTSSSLPSQSSVCNELNLSFLPSRDTSKVDTKLTPLLMPFDQSKGKSLFFTPSSLALQSKSKIASNAKSIPQVKQRQIALERKEITNASEAVTDISQTTVLLADISKAAFQAKSFELAKSYNKQSILAITNLLGDFVTFLTVCSLFRVMKPEIIILKSFLTESVYSLSDTTKSFLLILGMDLLVGFHSPRGWEIVLEGLLRHVGLPENENFVLLFVALFPVFLDTVFKYWIFRYLNKISPSTVVTYHSMIE